MRAHLCTCRILLQQFSLGTRPHKSRTQNYISTSTENGPAIARAVLAPICVYIDCTLLSQNIELATDSVMQLCNISICVNVLVQQVKVHNATPLVCYSAVSKTMKWHVNLHVGC